MSLFSSRYQGLQDVDSDFWDELRVNHEKIDESNPEQVLGFLIKNLKNEEKLDLCQMLGMGNEDTYNDELLIGNILKSTKSNDILYLKDFLIRKKRAVEQFYSQFQNDGVQYNSSELIKLIHIYISKPSKLFEILVLHEWKIKATGELYECSKGLKKNIMESIVTEISFQKKLTDTLFEVSGKETIYKVIAHCETNSDQYIYLLYKLNKDTKHPDFDKAKRLKDVDIILFSISLNDRIIEIKSNTRTEINGINRFLQGFSIEMTKINQEVYNNYSPEKVYKVFSEGEAFSGEEPSDFIINKIVFSNSLLLKSPEIILQLPKTDIWISVKDAFQKKVVDINSLKDISLIKFTSNNHSKSVRSIILENGNVIFKLDDSGIDEEIKKLICNKFFQKFGFPLNQPIENKFSYGEADKIDYLLGMSTESQVPPELELKFRELIDDNLFKRTEYIKYTCKDKHCGYESTDKSDFINGQCIKCSNDEFMIGKSIELNLESNNIEKLVVDCFLNYSKNVDNVIMLKPSRIKIKNKNYELQRFKYNDITFQFLVCGSILSPRTIQQIEKQLIPTLIIYYGIDKELAKLLTPNTIEYINFGLIYINQMADNLNKIIAPVLETLEERYSLYVATVAAKSNSTLKKIIGRTQDLIKDEYDDRDFEDDAYALLKEIIPNSEKWGKELSGKPVPEGVLAIQYYLEEGDQLEYKRVFTYDCKLTKNKDGYDLNISEKRKGIDYVERLNKLKEISSYCTDREINAHIFISNKFKEKQIPKMVDYFYKELDDKTRVKPVFIELDNLVYLHSYYCKNKSIFKKVPNLFYERLYSILTPDDNIITKDLIDEKLEEVVYVGSKKFNELETQRITNKLKKQ